MTPLEYFRIFASAFAAMTDEAVGVWLGIAETQIDVVCLDAERAAQAQALYAAHLIALSNTTATGSEGTVGPITSEKEGDLARTYGALQGSDTWMGQTPYGQQYNRLTLVCSGSAIMTRVVR